MIALAWVIALESVTVLESGIALVSVTGLALVTVLESAIVLAWVTERVLAIGLSSLIEYVAVIWLAGVPNESTTVSNCKIGDSSAAIRFATSSTTIVPAGISGPIIPTGPAGE